MARDSWHILGNHSLIKLLGTERDSSPLQFWTSTHLQRNNPHDPVIVTTELPQLQKA